MESGFTLETTDLGADLGLVADQRGTPSKRTLVPAVTLCAAQ